MKYLKLFEAYKDTDDEEDEQPVAEHVTYIKKRCAEQVEKLINLLGKLEHDFSYIPNKKNLAKNKADILMEVGDAQGMVDGGGLTCLWFADSYYLYVMPLEVCQDNAFGDSDNEVYMKIDKGEVIVLVMV